MWWPSRLHAITIITFFAICSNNVVLASDSSSSDASSDHSSRNISSLEDSHASHHSNHSHGVHVASWRLAYVREPLLLTLFALSIAVIKIGISVCLNWYVSVHELCSFQFMNAFMLSRTIFPSHGKLYTSKIAGNAQNFDVLAFSSCLAV